MSRRPINVMITGIGGGSHGMQILKALLLSDLDYHLIGTDTTPFSFGRTLVDQFQVVPRADDSDYLDALTQLIRINDVKVLFHGSEPELKVMSENSEVIRKLGVLLPINTPEVIRLCMNKLSTMDFLKRHGFPVPRTTLITSETSNHDIDYFPVVCKPHVDSGGSNNVFIAQDADDLRIVSRYLLKQVEAFIAQEYIGDSDSEYTVGVLCDMDGELVGGLALKRYIMSALSNRIKTPNRTGRSELGTVLAISSGISQGEIGPFPEVTQPCERIALALGARGPVNFQCRLLNDNVYVFEINPRYSGTTSMRAMAGFNEPDLMIRRHLLGQTLPPVNIASGVILRGLEERLILTDG